MTTKFSTVSTVLAGLCAAGFLYVLVVSPNWTSLLGLALALSIVAINWRARRADTQ